MLPPSLHWLWCCLPLQQNFQLLQVQKTPPKDIQVGVSGVQMLKLVVTEGGNGWGGDWVMWGNASLQ